MFSSLKLGNNIKYFLKTSLTKERVFILLVSPSNRIKYSYIFKFFTYSKN